MNQQTAWNNEYQNTQGVPTSTRKTASSAVTRLVSYINEHRPDLGKNVIDLGCGAGRNAIYLAGLGYSVTAVDFADNAVSKLAERLKGQPEGQRIDLKQLSLTDHLPFPDGFFDLAIDIVTTMTLTPSELVSLEKQLNRIIKPKGLFLSYVLAADDGFLEATNPGASSTTVASSGITDHYFTEDFLRSVYSNWNILVMDKISKQDDFYGREYTRRIWWMLAQHR
jgi:SAM-dependent methyltransferase